MGEVYPPRHVETMPLTMQPRTGDDIATAPKYTAANF